MAALIYLVSLFLAAILGFAPHRANLCTVRAVAEIFSSRRAYMMMGALKTVLWVMVVLHYYPTNYLTAPAKIRVLFWLNRCDSFDLGFIWVRRCFPYFVIH